MVQSWSVHGVVVWGFGSIVAMGHQNVRQKKMGLKKPPSRRLNALKYTDHRGNGKAKVSLDFF